METTSCDGATIKANIRRTDSHLHTKSPKIRALSFSRENEPIFASVPSLVQPQGDNEKKQKRKPSSHFIELFENDIINDSMESILSWSSIMKNNDIETPVLSGFGNYQLGDSIGKGGYGRVYKAFNMNTGNFVAIKEVKLNNGADVADLPSILEEIRLLKKLKHTNIVQYIDYYYEHEQALYIVLEYVENGSLKDIIKRFGKLPEELTARYTYQVLQGLNYLHAIDILHGDIKCANILITKEGICKLADFGVARQLSPNKPTTDFALGTTYWSAPEVLEKSNASKSADIWSLGCTVIELLTGKPPYKSFEPLTAVRKILENDYPPFPDNISSDLEDFLKICFQKDPLKRKTISQLLSHSWIKTLGRKRIKKPFFRNGSSSEDLNSFIGSINGPSNLYGMDYIKLEELSSFVDNNTTKLSNRFEKRSFEWINPSELVQDELRSNFCELQAENRLLHLLIHNLNEKLDKQNLSPGISKAIQRLETSQLKVSSDYKLAQVIFDKENIYYDTFPNAIRGILLIKKDTRKKSGQSTASLHRWKKRWIVLQDNFLFCFKPDSKDIPNITVLLNNINILPIAERDIGKKNCFHLSNNQFSYYFVAAKPDILMKWIEAFTNIKYWYNNKQLFNSIEKESKITHQQSRRTKTVPINRITSKRKLMSLLHGNSDDSPFPGIALQVEQPKKDNYKKYVSIQEPGSIEKHNSIQ